MITEYQYNSQDQITKYSHSGQGDVRTYRNIYDYAGRLHKVDYYTGSPDAPDPDYLNLAEYEYNPNSQISIQKYNDAFMQNEYSYNERNWITEVDNSSKLFEYSNRYFKNGNVKSMEISGDYSLNFAVPSDLTFDYEYDRSNRLTQTKNTERNFTVVNTYDKDGNIITLDRNGSTGNSIDDFNYSYFSGTNKLSKVTGSVNQYAYDANGNMTRDDLNKNFDIIYDHRNLIVQLKQLIIDIHGSKNDTTIYQTFYYYDEAGNRIRKMTYDTEDDSLKSDIIYSRDVSGRELAVYENGSIKQWNLFGLDNIGYMTGSDDLRFYLKDHLGSVRVVTDNQSTVINCQDYDPWGYVLENRIYQSDESVYKFTSKERDEESQYDYFGARYYDARIGRWGQVEPLYDEYLNLTPYNYAANCPLTLADANGLENIVVVGGIDVTQKDPYKFINSGILAANDLNTTGEKTTIVLLTAYINASDIAGIQSSIGNINLVLANSSDELINYINSGTTSSSEITEQRSNDKITDLAVFGHGVEGNLDIGYDSYNGRSSVEETFSINQAKLGNINNNAFSKTSSTILYTCNSATTSLNGVNIAQVFSTSTNGSVTGYSGLVSYYNIYSGAGLSNRFSRFITGGIGSAVNYPTEYKGSEVKTYKGGQ